jgi:hypothetical protein
VTGAFSYSGAWLLGLALRDTLLTADEYQGMADGLADTAVASRAAGGTYIRL